VGLRITPVGRPPERVVSVVNDQLLAQPRRGLKQNQRWPPGGTEGSVVPLGTVRSENRKISSFRSRVAAWKII